MEISLNKEQEKFVNELISNGTYYSPSEAVRDGLRLLKEQEELKKIRTEELKSEILKGYEQSRRGESRPLDIEAIKDEGRRRLAEKGK